MKENLHQRIKRIIAPLTALEKAVYLFTEAVRLHVLYGAILTTPAKEIKKMKLRQIKKELKALNAKSREADK